MKPLAILLLTSTLAAAVPVNWEFTGIISSSYSQGVDDFNVSDGATFRLILQYDTAAPDQLASSTLGRYTASGFTFTTDAHQFTSLDGSCNLWVQDGPDRNDTIALAYLGWTDAPWGRTWSGLDIVLDDYTRTAIASDAAPSEFDLARWSSSTISFGGGNGGPEFQLAGTITSISRIPDSGSTALMLLASLALIGGVSSSWNNRTRVLRCP